MRQPEDYFNAAMRKNHLHSDRQLARSIGVAPGCITRVRKRHGHFNTETMIALADLAGVPRDEALLDLAIWSASSEDVRSAYMSAWKKVAMMMVAVICFTWPNGPATAASSSPKSDISSIYIMRLMQRIKILFTPYGATFA